MATETTDRIRILKGIVKGHARRDAALFVEEFGVPIDPDSGDDWDATAWNETICEMKAAGNKPTKEELEILWEVYRAALVQRSEELCGA